MGDRFFIPSLYGMSTINPWGGDKLVLPMMKVPSPQTRQWTSSPPPAAHSGVASFGCWPLLAFLGAPITTGTTLAGIRLSLDGDRGLHGPLPKSIFLGSVYHPHVLTADR